MNNLLLFLPLATCLLLVFGGLASAIRAGTALRRARAGHQHPPSQGPQPPLLSDATQRSTAAHGCWTLCLKGFLMLGLGAMTLGLLGAWCSGVSIHWERNPAVEWSDGGAPALEPLIRKRCVPFLTQGKSIGLAVALVTPTNTTIMTFGHPSLASGIRTRTNTLFEIGSITKTFTGLALAREIDQGLVRLDQPAQELLPAGVQLPDEARGVTLRQLTTHSSGFPRLAANQSQLRVFGMLLFGIDPYAGYTQVDLMEAVRSVELESKPGTSSSYSNFGMTLLGYLLARKAGCTWEALVKQQVCLPLGLRDTTATLDASQAPRAAQPYRAVWRYGPLVVALRSDPWFVDNPLGGAGALRSTASDMLNYLKANMHPEGQPLVHALRESHQVLFKEDEHTAFGMNWIHLQSPKLNQPLIWHNGGTGGFSSFLGFTEDGQFGALILSNTSEDVDQIAIALLGDLAGKLAQPDQN